jgi:serine/threonine-protein kinase
LAPSRRTEIEVPGSLDRLILQCLEKDPAARPESGRRLVELLAGCDGVEPWTQNQAERWWCTHRPQKGLQCAARAAGAGDQNV